MPATPGQQIAGWNPGPSLERLMNIPSEYIDHQIRDVNREKLIGRFMTSSQVTDYTGYPRMQRSVAESLADNELARQAEQSATEVDASRPHKQTISLVTSGLAGVVRPTIVNRSRVNC